LIRDLLLELLKGFAGTSSLCSGAAAGHKVHGGGRC
jgi:hypothetical protein